MTRATLTSFTTIWTAGDGCDPTTGTEILVSADETRDGIDFELTQGTTISGRVVDDVGIGLFGVRVMIFNGNNEFVGQAWTDEEGYYTVDGLTDGVFFARASAWHYFTQLYDGIDCTGGCVVNTGTPIPAAEGEQVVAIDFALVRGGSISGMVTDAATGSPLELVLVEVVDGDGETLRVKSSIRVQTVTTS